MKETSTKRGFITNNQKEMMVEYLKKNPDLVSGKFSSTFTFKDATRKWNELTDILNSIPGCRKDWKSWRKTWQDMRSRVKTKISKNKSHLCGTGGGPFREDPPTKFEEDVIDIIKLVSIEGHKSIEENIITFDFESNFTGDMDTQEVEGGPSNIDIDEHKRSSVSNINNDENGESETPKKAAMKNVNDRTRRKIPKRQSKALKSTLAVEMFQKTYEQKKK